MQLKLEEESERDQRQFKLRELEIQMLGHPHMLMSIWILQAILD